MTWTKDEFEKLYARFTESGLSIRDFCFNEDHTQPSSGCLCEICYPNGVVVHMSGDMPVEVYRALVLLN